MTDSKQSKAHLLNELLVLYENKSKHSSYQILPTKLKAILDHSSLTINSRYEQERLNYLLKVLNVRKSKVIDIGANTGYFTFELVENGAEHVDYFEGNQEHANFVKTAVSYFGLADKISVHNEYFKFNNKLFNKYDIALLFNVLHHTGDDYGDVTLDQEKIKVEILRELNTMSYNARICVFQLGFNMHGDIRKPLFNDGTKSEVIEFVSNGTSEYWDISEIAVAEKRGKRIAYSSLNDSNILRMDELGEFLNRPIFILKSKKYDE